MNRTFVDIHILQTVPPSNLNRDDTGSPKTAVYGGVRRARVSSQAWKRATRKEFDSLLDSTQLGVRTKRVVEIVAEEIENRNLEISADQAVTAAKEVLEAAGIKLAEPRGKKGATPESGYLLFLSQQQISALAEMAIEAIAAGEKPDKAIAKSLIADKNSVDLALFGRMVADVSDLNVDASCQVAHSLSTHGVETEYDYYTAVDDKKAASEDEDAGAGMIGTVEFNSATLYRYATIDVNQLHKNLGSLRATEEAVHAFLESFIKSMPTGKQNTFANRTIPDAVVISVRDDQPVSYVGAFEEPVKEGVSGGYVQNSAVNLAEYAQEVERNYGKKHVVHTWVSGFSKATEPLSDLGEVVMQEAAVDAATKLVGERLAAQA